MYYAFDVMVLAGREVMREPLEVRRELLERKVLPKLAEPIRYASSLDADLPVLIESVKAQSFEGLVAKRRNSMYEPGLRSGAWQKMRVNRSREFVIGGFTRGGSTPMRHFCRGAERSAVGVCTPGAVPRRGGSALTAQHRAVQLGGSPNPRTR